MMDDTGVKQNVVLVFNDTEFTISWNFSETNYRSLCLYLKEASKYEENNECGVFF